MPTATITIPDTATPEPRRLKAPGHSYVVVDRLGTVHRRYSATHAEPRYLWAVVRYAGTLKAPVSPGKAGVSFASRRDLAEKHAATMRESAERWMPGGTLVDVLPVTATAGRPRPRNA